MIPFVRKFAKDNFMIQVANITMIITGMLIHTYLTKGQIITNADYATFTVIITLIGTLSTLVTAGIPLYAIRKYAQGERNANTFIASFIITFVMSIIIALVLSFGKDSIGNTIFSDASKNNLLLLVGLVIFGYWGNSLIISFFNAQKNFMLQGFFIALGGIIKLISVIFLTSLWGLEGAILSYGLSGCIFFLLFITFKWQAILKRYRSIFQDIVQLLKKREFIVFVLPVIIYAFVYSSMLSLEILFVENSFNPHDISFFAAATTLSKVGIAIMLALGSVYYPQYAQFQLQSVKEQKKLLRNHFLLELLIAFLGYSVVLLLGSVAIELVYGDAFRDALPILIAHYPGGIAYAILGLVTTKLQALGKPGVALFSILISLGIMRSIGPILINTYGMVGASILLGVSCLPVIIALYFYLAIRN